MDTGATKHMISHGAAFDTYEVIASLNVHLGGNSIIKTMRMGSIVMEVIMKSKANRIRIKDVLHVPKLQANFFSINKFLSSRLKVQFNLNECIFEISDGKTIVITPHKGNFYQINLVKVYVWNVVNLVQSSMEDGGFELFQTLQTMMNVMNFNKVSCLRSSLVCESCPTMVVVDKSSKLPKCEDREEQVEYVGDNGRTSVERW